MTDTKRPDYVDMALGHIADLELKRGLVVAEMALLIATHVLKVCEALKIPPDPRLTKVVETGQKALQKKAEVEAAETVEELEGVEWT